MPDDPATGLRTLTESAYAGDRHLRSRQTIWVHAEQPAEPGWAHPDGRLGRDSGGGRRGLRERLRPAADRSRGPVPYAIGVDLSAWMLRSLDGLRGTAGSR
jgi:hypothetical protein